MFFLRFVDFASIFGKMKKTERAAMFRLGGISMKEVVRVGYIGLGRRGMAMLKDCFAQMSDVQVVAVCDVAEKKNLAARDLLLEMGRPAPGLYTDYRDMLKNETLDAAVIMTGWNDRLEMAMDAMNSGLYTAIEVGCAYDISQCYALIETYERTKSPVMMLENGCYDRREMAAIAMARKGAFGRIVQCVGGYRHDLRREDLLKQNKDGTYDVDHYRMTEYVYRNCDQYPTHELGPISKLLKLNRGNRMLSLRSITTGAVGLHEYARDHLPEDHPFYNTPVAQSDIVTTFIECSNGEQIMLTLDTTLPRPFYCRDFSVRGTKGMCIESSGKVCTWFMDGQPKAFNNEAQWLEENDHPLHREYRQQVRGGHDGIDWLTTRAFVESVKRGIEPPIDAYDTALWLSIAPLSEMSIAQGGAAVPVPDFTNGKWFRREPPVFSKYSLDEVCEDPDTPIVP